MRKALSNIFYGVVLLAAVAAIGTIGSMQLLHLGPVDALYYTIVTMSSVGYGDIVPQSPEAKLFTVFLIISGLTLLFYLVSAFVSGLVKISLPEMLRLGRIRDRLRKMKNHLILCGYGDIGVLIAEGYGKEGLVVVERDEQRFNEIVENEYVGVHGDSTHSKTLVTAGVKDAKAMIIALDSDADAVYTTLAAKELNPGIKVYVRANERGSENKMRRAGADYVICLPSVGSGELLKAMGLNIPKKC